MYVCVTYVLYGLYMVFLPNKLPHTFTHIPKTFQISITPHQQIKQMPIEMYTMAHDRNTYIYIYIYVYIHRRWKNKYPTELFSR